MGISALCCAMQLCWLLWDYIAVAVVSAGKFTGSWDGVFFQIFLSVVSHYRNAIQFSSLLSPVLISVAVSEQRFEASLMLSV